MLVIIDGCMRLRVKTPEQWLLIMIVVWGSVDSLVSVKCNPLPSRSSDRLVSDPCLMEIMTWLLSLIVQLFVGRFWCMALMRLWFDRCPNAQVQCLRSLMRIITLDRFRVCLAGSGMPGWVVPAACGDR